MKKDNWIKVLVSYALLIGGACVIGLIIGGLIGGKNHEVLQSFLSVGIFFAAYRLIPYFGNKRG